MTKLYGAIALQLVKQTWVLISESYGFFITLCNQKLFNN